jgi:hypothetical protein
MKPRRLANAAAVILARPLAGAVSGKLLAQRREPARERKKRRD